MGTFRVVTYGSIALVTFSFIVPMPCAGAQSSARLEWLEREKMIEEAIRAEADKPQPPEQP